MRSIQKSRPEYKSHIHMVIVFAMLTADADNAETNEPFTLKQAVASLNWLKFKKVMQAEHDPLIQNNLWELVPTPTI